MAAQSLLWSLLSFVHRTVIFATILTVVVICYIIRTYSPRLERPKPAKKSGAGKGGAEPKENFDKDEAKAIVEAMTEAEEITGEGGEEEEEEEEGSEDQGGSKSRNRVIREVTVRHIVLPPDAKYSDLQKLAARQKVMQALDKKKVRDTSKSRAEGGEEFDQAVRRIKAASETLEDEAPRKDGPYVEHPKESEEEEEEEDEEE